MILLLPALAAGQGQGEAALFDQISGLRLEIERLEDTRQAVTTQRDRLAGELEQLAARIRKNKADRPDGALIPDFALQGMLRKSQELSESLTLLNKEIQALRSARTERLQRLGKLYGQLVDLTARQIRTASGARQKQLVRVLAKVRHERDQVRRELGNPALPRAPMDTRNLLATDDPEELSERADAVSDEQDRLRRRLASLDRRILEIRADRRLERDMRDFVEDHTLFGEESRILQLSRQATSNPNADAAVSGEGGRQDFSDSTQHEDESNLDPTPDADGAGFPGAGDSAGALDGTLDIETRGGQVPVNLEGADSDLGQMDPQKQIQILKRRRLQVVEQIKKLQILHDRLREKAESLMGE